MNLHELRRYLDILISSLKHEDRQLLEARLNSLVSIFPLGITSNNIEEFDDYKVPASLLADAVIIKGCSRLNR